MDYIMLVQTLETLQQLKGNLPDSGLFEACSRVTVLSRDEFVLHRIEITCRSPPSAYSMSTHSSLVSRLKKEPSYFMTVGMLIEASRRTSLRALSFSFWLRRLSLTDLRAYRVWHSVFLTSVTFPKLPEPSYLMSSKSLMDSWVVYCIMSYRRI